MWPDTREKVETELGLLRRLISDYGELLSQDTAAGGVDVLGVSAVLHSFYTGVESVFKRIALEIDADMPASGRWHADLLPRMAEPNAMRAAVISPELRQRLVDYMYFRHVFRHAYSFQLDWEKMSGLARDAEETLRLLEAELVAFFGPEDNAKPEA